MDSTYRGIVASLRQLTTFELVDLLSEIGGELDSREADYEELLLDGSEITEDRWSEYAEMCADEGRE